MNILVNIGDISNNIINANNKIGLVIANQMIIKGNNCSIVAFDYFAEEQYEKYVDNLRIKVYPYNRNNCHIIKKTSFKYLIFKMNDYCELCHETQRIIDAEQIDTIICVSLPFKSTYKQFMKLNVNKKVLLQLDPWGFNETLKYPDCILRKTKEIILFMKTNEIFTTDILFEKYTNDFVYSFFVNKMHRFYFPNIVKYNTLDNLPYKKCIVFTGTINDSFRNPKQFLDFFVDYVRRYDSTMVVLFYGKNDSKLLLEYEKRFKDNIKVLGMVDEAQAKNIINSDNVYLLNINNSLKNQSPSKLLDYIATGNPIINVVKHPKDYSLSILNGYDGVFNYFEYGDNSVDDFNNFIVSFENSRIPFEKIVDKYYKYTPEYAINNVINTIKK